MATKAQIAALRNLMGTLLMSSAAQQIDFYLDRFHVDGSGLAFIALALLSKPTRGHGLSIRIAHLPPTADAEYDTATNTFTFPSATYGSTAFQRAAIIHECVHALRDSHGRRLRTGMGLTTTSALSDEAAAFLAGALFNIFDTTAPGTTPTAPSWTQGTGRQVAPFAVAHALAVKMRAQMGFAVTPQDAKALRDAVMNHPTYRDLKLNPRLSSGNNGIKL